MTSKIKISVISPVYRAENIISELVLRVKKAVEVISEEYEIVLVEDCGPDSSWEAIKLECEKDTRVRGIKLSRNFGQHYAINCGLEHAKGEWVVVMDCDLQDQPEEIPHLFNKTKVGYKIVQAQRFERQDGFFKRMTSKLFYNALSYLTGVKHDASIANFGIYHRDVIKAILSMKESIKYFPTMVKWVGYKTTTIEVLHAERLEGKSSYSLKRLLNLALDIILAYSDKPIRLVVKMGLVLSMTSFLFALIYLMRAVVGDFSVGGYASLIISIWFFSGIIISILGVIGLYVGKTFESVKQRPIFIIGEKINVE